jgi:hypothetical protein
MTRNDLLAIFVFALDYDLIDRPFVDVAEEFMCSANKCVKYSFDLDKLESVPVPSTERERIAFMTDYMLVYARVNIISGLVTYDKFDDAILRTGPVYPTEL